MAEYPAFESVWSDLQGVPFSQGFLEAGGVRTRYLHAGDRDKPTLVLLHGSGGHAEAYVRNLESHAEHFSTWSIDMLGHGYTDKPGHPLEVAHYVDHLLAVFDAIGADRVHLSGESLGGWVAARAASDHPGPHRPPGAQHRRRLAGRPRGDEAHHQLVDGRSGESVLGDGAGTDQVADGRQDQGLRRHRGQSPARVPPAGVRRGHE